MFKRDYYGRSRMFESFVNVMISLGIGVTVVFWAILLVRSTLTENECLALGYRDSQLALGGVGQAYCVTRSDQTDIVVPLEQAREKPLTR